MFIDIYDLLGNSNARISLGNRWLVYDHKDIWTVYERKPYAKKTTTIIETVNERTAIEELVD